MTKKEYKQLMTLRSELVRKIRTGGMDTMLSYGLCLVRRCQIKCEKD